MRLFGSRPKPLNAPTRYVKPSIDESLREERQSLAMELDRIKRELNNARDEWALSREKLTLDLVSYQQFTEAKKQELESVVAALEERKREAMRPLDAEKQRIFQSIREVEAKILSLQERELTLEEREEYLAVSENHQVVEDRKISQARMNLQRERTALQKEDQRIKDFRLEVETLNETLRKRRNRLDKQESKLENERVIFEKEQEAMRNYAAMERQNLLGERKKIELERRKLKAAIDTAKQRYQVT